MRQSSLRYVGYLDLLAVVAVLAAFGLPALVGSPIVPLMAAAGVLAVLAGYFASMSVGSVTVGWRQLVFASYALFALMWPATYVPQVLSGSTTEADLFLLVVTSVGALILLFVGVDIGRGGRHFHISPDVERTVRV